MSEFDLQAAGEFLSDYQEDPYPGDYPEAGVAVAITDDARPRLVMTRRPMTMKIHKGECAFPGGKWEPGDENLLHTALREMEEEVGIPMGDFQPLGELRQRRARSQIRMHPFVGLIPANTELKPDPHEIDAAFFIPLSHLAEWSNYELIEMTRDGFTRPQLILHYDGFKVWGVTAMILADLMKTVFDADIPLDVNRR